MWEVTFQSYQGNCPPEPGRQISLINGPIATERKWSAVGICRKAGQYESKVLLRWRLSVPRFISERKEN